MAYKLAPDAQEAIASARYVRMSATKARQVTDLIRGRHVEDARRVLRFTPRGASVEVLKVLESAIANAEHNRQLPADELIVVRTWVDEGPTLKRYRPRAMGRATRIRKRMCHIAVVVGRTEDTLTALAPPTTETKRRRRKDTSKGPASSGESSTKSRKSTAKKTTAKSTAKKTTAKKTAAKKTTAKKTTRRKPKEESE